MKINFSNFYLKKKLLLEIFIIINHIIITKFIVNYMLIV